MDQGSKQWRSLTAHINSYIRMAINDQRHTMLYMAIVDRLFCFSCFMRDITSDSSRLQHISIP